MSERWRVSSKRLELPKLTAQSFGADWKWQRRPGGWWVARAADGRQLRVLGHEGKGRLALLLDGSAFAGELSQESRASATGGGADPSDFTAQFPGKVRKLLVAAGAPVAEGEPLLLVEAMKMEFAVRAPAAGRVLKWRVSEGQQLQPGDLFLDWEANSGSST